MAKTTTAVGDAFEAKVFAFFKAAIRKGQFFARPECCKIFRKKGYFSRDRGAKIVFDIAIEVSDPLRRSCAVLVLIECKGYSHPVPVDDAEEFYAKIQQVAGGKGIIVTTNAFQEGTLRFAESKRIALARYVSRATLKWDLLRSPSMAVFGDRFRDVARLHRVLTSAHVVDGFDFHGLTAGMYTYSVRDFFGALGADAVRDVELRARLEAPFTSPKPVVRYLPTEQIERSAVEVLQQVRYTHGPVPLDAVCAWQAVVAGLEVQRMRAEAADDDVAILGRITFSPLKITLFEAPDRNRARERFTLAHELGHLLLGHARYMRGEYCDSADIEAQAPSEVVLEDIRAMEWQANTFASCLLLPHGPFVDDFWRVARALDLEDHGFGVLYVDRQPCNLASFHAVTSALMQRYEVSRTVVRIRLQGLGLLRAAPSVA